MPQTYQFEAESGNVYEFERPDDMPESQFMQYVEKDLATIAQQRAQEQQQATDPSLAAAQEMAGKGVGMASNAAGMLGGLLSGQPPQQMKDFAVGGLEGMRRFGSGPVQALYGVGEKVGLADPGAYDRFTQAEAQQRQQFDAGPGQSPWAQGGVVAGELAPAVAMPVAGGPGIGAIAANTALGAALGGTQYVPEGESRTQKALLGGAFPLAFGGLGRGYSYGKKWLGKGVEPRAAEVAAMGQKLDIPVYAADIGGPGTQVTGTLMENAPIGMRTARIDQAKAADAAIDTIEKRLAKELIESPMETTQLLQAEVAKGGAHKDIAQKGLSYINEDAADWGKIMEGGVIRQMAGRKILSKENYNHVSQLSQGLKPIVSFNTESEIQKIIKELNAQVTTGPELRFFSTANKGLNKFRIGPEKINALTPARKGTRSNLHNNGQWLKSLRGEQPVKPLEKSVRWTQGLQGKTIIEPIKKSPVLSREAPIISKKTAMRDDWDLRLQGKVSAEKQPELTMDFNQLRKFRQELDSVKRDYYKGDRSLVGDAGVQYLERLDDAIEKDMDKMAETYGGQVKDAYLKAKAYYKKYVVPYTNKDLTRAVNNEKWDEAYGFFMKGGQERAKLIYNQMDERGKAAMRYGLFQTAVENSTGEKGVSLAKLATNLHKERKAAHVIFKGTDYDIQGMGNLFRHIQRASWVRESPPTGNRFVQAFLSGYTVLNPSQIPAVAGGIVAGHGARAAMNSNWLRNYLIAASRLKPGSKEMEKLVTKIDQRMARAGIAAGQAITNE